jgi:hypothetical protein
VWVVVPSEHSEVGDFSLTSLLSLRRGGSRTNPLYIDILSMYRTPSQSEREGMHKLSPAGLIK